MELARKRPSMTGIMVRESIRLANRHLPVLKKYGIFRLGARYAKGDSNWKIPKQYRISQHKITNGTMEILIPYRVETDKIIYQLHGGGYVMGYMDLYREMAKEYSKYTGGYPVASLDYRTAPKNRFPKALNDAIEGWELLLKLGFPAEKIILVGDSAGGNLALALTMYLRDKKRELPGGMVLLSPWADMAAQGKSYRKNCYHDPMFGTGKGKKLRIRRETFAYVGKTDRKNPYLSPVYGEFHKFPQMLIQVGTWEMLESDSIAVYKKAKKAGVNAKLEKYPGMFHVFQMYPILPESRYAWKKIGEFIKSC